MNRDIAAVNEPGRVGTDDERLIVKRNLASSYTADFPLPQQHRAWDLSPYHGSECAQYLLRQAFEEAIHTHAYQYIAESLGLDQSEIFAAYRK